MIRPSIPLRLKLVKTTTLKVSDTPKATNTQIELFKLDMDTAKGTPQGNAALEIAVTYCLNRKRKGEKNENRRDCRNPYTVTQ